MRAKWNKFSDEKLKNAVKDSKSYSGVLRNLGAGSSGSTHQYFKKRINKLRIDTSHFGAIKTGVIPKSKLSASEILINNRLGRREATYKLRRAMLEYGFKYICDICKRSPTWEHKKLRLEMDHIDGNALNNNSENLRFVCPNCHSQLDTTK